MMIKQTIETDLKAAMLGGDKVLVTTLRGLKSAILYEEVANGNRDQGGLTDDEIVVLFMKEAKKRQESAELFDRGGNSEKATAERLEKKVIEKYLPKQLSDEELLAIVDEVTGGAMIARSDMGKAIGQVKVKVGTSADGGRIAAAVQKKVQV